MWRLVGSTATWQCDQLLASIELQRPAEGLSDIAFQGQSLGNTALMQMHLAPDVDTERVQLNTCYIRGDDLVTSYADIDGRVCPEFYWRVTPGQGDQVGMVMIEVVVSTQTDWLDSDPMVEVRCRLAASSCTVKQAPNSSAGTEFLVSQLPASLGLEWGASGCGLAFQLTQRPMVFAQMFPAADVVRADLKRDATKQTITSTVSFFGGRVEKGVIRRARMRAVLAPEDTAHRVLPEMWSEMLVAPPPLAT